MMYITHFTEYWHLVIVKFLCEWHQLHLRLQFKSPSCLPFVFPCFETPSRLYWAFSSFHHPPLCKSSSANSSGPRWGQHFHLLRAFCFFVCKNGDYNPFWSKLFKHKLDLWTHSFFPLVCLSTFVRHSHSLLVCFLHMTRTISVFICWKRICGFWNVARQW